MLATRICLSKYPPWTAPSRFPPSPLKPPVPYLPLRRPPPSTPPSQIATSTHPPLPPPPAGFKRTTHAVPAAYPRSHSQAAGTLSRSSHPLGPGPPAGTEDKPARAERLAAEANESVRIRSQSQRWRTAEQGIAANQAPMWVHAERWSREARRGGSTLVLTHACGLQKEHWHPALHALVAGTPDGGFGGGAAGAPVVVDDVWMLDDSHHGLSVELNAGRLGAAHSWEDTGRDVLSLVENVLPGVRAAEAAGGELGWVLPWAEAGEAEQVVGIGHSYGGNALVQAAHARPDLFSGLLLVEPMTIPVVLNAPPKYPLTSQAVKRRTTWASRAAAAESVRSNPLFGPWTDDVFALWLSHSLAPVDEADPDGPVTLATPGWAEAAAFTDSLWSAERGWDKLQTLGEGGRGVKTGFIMAGDETWMSGEETAAEMVSRIRGARNERIVESSHLIVQEQPQLLAASIGRFLASLPSWNDPRAKL